MSHAHFVVHERERQCDKQASVGRLLMVDVPSRSPEFVTKYHSEVPYLNTVSLKLWWVVMCMLRILLKVIPYLVKKVFAN